MRHSSEGVSYHDGPTNRSTILREDTDFLDSNVYKINSTGNQMFIRYHSPIEQPRVYGFLLHFECIPTASTIVKHYMFRIEYHSDQDCFIEDNTLESRSTKPFRSWRIPGYGDRHYKKMTDSRVGSDKLPHAAALNKARQDGQSFNKMLKNKEGWHHLDLR